MANSLTRKELLKQDQFAVQVGHSVDFLGAHRQQAIRYGGAILVVALVVAGGFYYRNSQSATRQAALAEAISLTTAPVAQQQVPPGVTNFATDGAKRDAVTKAFTELINKHGGSDEAYISEYYLASMDADGAKLADARRRYQDVADHASAGYASIARLALAQINVAENRVSDAEAIFKDLIANPTDLVSKDQATIAYARAIGPTRPDDARKMLKPLTDVQSDISSIAIQVVSDLPK